jgi:hypothetical protein
MEDHLHHHQYLHHHQDLSPLVPLSQLATMALLLTLTVNLGSHCNGMDLLHLLTCQPPFLISQFPPMGKEVTNQRRKTEDTRNGLQQRRQTFSLMLLSGRCPLDKKPGCWLMNI